MNMFKYVFFAVCVSALLMAGCNEPQTPSTKQSRLIAAENIELKKQIEQLNIQIENLKTQHRKDIELQKALLDAAKTEIETWKEKSQQNVRDQVQDVLDNVIQENAELHKEIENLNKLLETQRVQITELEKMLKEKPDQ